VASIPNCKVHVAVARSAFFYWVWLHAAPDPAHESMRRLLQPAFVRDHCTILPSALGDGQKLECAVGFLLDRLRAALEAWTKTCADAIDAHIKRMADKGPVVH